jgi:PAS domain-containing protein
MCGYKWAELKDAPFGRFFHEKDQARILMTIESGAEHGLYSEFNLRIIRKSGREVIVNLSGHRVSEGYRSFIIFTLHNITDLQKAQEDLEHKIQLRTQALRASQNRIRSILNSSQQGFLTFDSEMKIEDDYSVRAEKLLGSELTGKSIFTALNLNEKTFAGFARLIFQGNSWHIIEKLATIETVVDERILKLEFAPVLEDKNVVRVLCTITDVSNLKKLEQRNEEMAREGRSIIKILQAKTIFLNLVKSVGDMTEQDEMTAKRLVHTLKGEFAFFECHDLVSLCQQWEEKWSVAYTPGDLRTFSKRFKKTIEAFLQRYGNALKISPSDFGSIEVAFSAMNHLARTLEATSVSPEILTVVDRLIEHPPEVCFAWLSDTWVMVAESLQKKVRPIIWKKSVPIFTEPYKKLFATLVHAVRNSADHGIELPEDRLLKGKPEYGQLFGEILLEGEHYHLKLRDDGRGVDLDAIKAKAKRRGLPVPRNEEEALSLLFEAKFSTRDIISQYSGLGVGLNAVQFEARALDGDAQLHSIPGGGLEVHVWFKKTPTLEALLKLK